MYNLWDNGCESYVYKPCVAHGKGMVYMSPIVTPTIIPIYSCPFLRKEFVTCYALMILRLNITIE